MTAPARWEYCTVTQVLTGPLMVTVTFYRPDGAETVHHRTRNYDDAVNRLWPSIIADLGRAGWELTAVDAGAWFFKRPLGDETA